MSVNIVLMDHCVMEDAAVVGNGFVENVSRIILSLRSMMSVWYTMELKNGPLLHGCPT